MNVVSEIKAIEERPTLKHLVEKYNKDRRCFRPSRSSIEEIENLQQNFVRDFSKEKISKLTLDEYAAGYIDPKTKEKKENSFSYRIDKEMIPFGSIENPSGMFTHEIFIRKETQEPDYKKKKYKSAEEALEKTKSMILDLLDAGENDDIASIEKISLHSFLKSKILAIYFPEKFIDIHTKTGITEIVKDINFLNHEEIQKLSVFGLQKALVKYKEQNDFLKNLHYNDYSHILWIFYQKGKLSKSLVENETTAFLEDLSEFNIPKTHIQVLKKFQKNSGKYLRANQIFGTKKSSTEKILQSQYKNIFFGSFHLLSD